MLYALTLRRRHRLELYSGYECTLKYTIIIVIIMTSPEALTLAASQALVRVSQHRLTIVKCMLHRGSLFVCCWQKNYVSMLLSLSLSLPLSLSFLLPLVIWLLLLFSMTYYVYVVTSLLTIKCVSLLCQKLYRFSLLELLFLSYKHIL